MIVFSSLLIFTDFDDTASDLVGVVDEELAVIHARKDLHMRCGVQRAPRPYLRFGNERLLGAVPEMNVIARDSFQTVGLDGFIAVQ